LIYLLIDVGLSEQSERDPRQTNTWLLKSQTSQALLLVIKKFAQVEHIN